MRRRTLGEHAEAGEHALIAADLVEREVRDDEAAEHEQGHLDDIGERHCLEAAIELIEQGEAAEPISAAV
jgi:hypothetical protein